LSSSFQTGQLSLKSLVAQPLEQASGIFAGTVLIFSL
jgi:hypothetical protein